jgi:hypothetical protein
MRNLTEFSWKEQITLLPVRHAMKQIRNDAWMAFYRRRHSPGLPRFIAEARSLAGKNIALVIAFEQPGYLNWLLHMAKANFTDATVLVFDNSRNADKRREIEKVCTAIGVAYLALPANGTTHVNRSHGMAMSWVYHNVVRAIRPRIFGFIDHDLIPAKRITIADKLSKQPIYGLLNVGKFGFWSLWAGYCFFNYSATGGLPLNFLYDFSRDLDTGGRNWRALYRHYDRSALQFASSEHITMRAPGVEKDRQVQWVDQSWMHIGGISYHEAPRDRIEFYAAIEASLRQG